MENTFLVNIPCQLESIKTEEVLSILLDHHFFVPLYPGNLLPKSVQTGFLGQPLENLSPKKKCRLFSFPCFHHPRAGVGRLCGRLPIV